MNWRAGLVSLFVVLCCAVVVLGDAPAKPSGCKPLHGVTYDPFAVSTDNICLSKEQVVIDVAIMATFTKSIRLYNVAVCPETTRTLLAEAKKHDLTVLLGLFIGQSAEDNEKEIKTMTDVMKKYSGVVQAIVVGSDAIVSGKIGSTNRFVKILSNVELLVDFIERVKKILRQNRWTHPVTTAEGWGVWESKHGAELVDAVDFICLKVTPFFEGRTVACSLRAKRNCISAAVYANARATGLSKFYSKDVWMCETSWPTAGGNCCAGIPDKKNGFQAVPSPKAASTYLNEFVDLSGSRPYFISSAFDRDWRRIWAPCANCAEKNLALSSFKNGICDLCDQEYLMGIFDQHRERKSGYKIPSVKCSLPGLPETRLATPAPKKKPAVVVKVSKKPTKPTKSSKPSKKPTSKSTAPKKKTKTTSKTSKKTPAPEVVKTVKSKSKKTPAPEVVKAAKSKAKKTPASKPTKKTTTKSRLPLLPTKKPKKSRT